MSVTIYDPPSPFAPMGDWLEYLNALDPVEDRAEVERTKAEIQRLFGDKADV